MTAGTTSRKPSLRVERALQREGHRLLAGMDEVGRGALAGPVSVGVVVIDDVCRSAPVGVKDSKLLSHRKRERMVPKIQKWATAYAVGHASPGEIDAFGIMVALRLAGNRALAALPVIPDLVILDGNYDWLTDPERVGLLGFADSAHTPCVPVMTMVKA
ncbi:MAG: ribonuclease HII, partial [Dermatophilaceae bacterium]